MKYLGIILVSAVLGVALGLPELSGFLGAFKKVGNGIKNAGEKVGKGVKDTGKKATNGVKDTGKKAVNGVKDTGKKAVNGVKDTGKTTVGKVNTIGKTSVDKVTDTGKQTVGKVQDGIVNTVGKQGILKGFQEAKRGFMKFGKLTERSSKQFANEVKKISLEVGKVTKLDQIRPEHLQAVLKGIRMVTGPTEAVICSPQFEEFLKANDLDLLPPMMVFKTAVKLINNPEDYQNILLDSNQVSDLIGHFVIDTVNNPDNWMENLFVAAPKAINLLQTAVRVAGIIATMA